MINDAGKALLTDLLQKGVAILLDDFPLHLLLTLAAVACVWLLPHELLEIHKFCVLGCVSQLLIQLVVWGGLEVV